MSAVGLVAGQVLGGDYRIVQKLDEGGMGEVYIAEQLSTGKRRALKLMRLHIANNHNLVQRFAREARVASCIDSEHVVEVIAAGVDDKTGLPWLAMELLSGESLFAHVTRRGPMPPSDVILVFRQLGHALTAAHAAHIVHRDLKPENVFVAVSKRVDVPFTIKVLDFGIAKFVASTTSAQNSQVVGSPAWMAPEQLNARGVVGPATDVWALGLMAFYLLTGRNYWVAANIEVTNIQPLIKEVAVDVMPLASARARELGAPVALSPAFDEWFARACARDSRTRIAGVPEAIALLEKALCASPLPAAAATQQIAGTTASSSPTPPPSSTTVTGVRSAPWRSPWLAVGGVGLFVGLLVLMALYLTGGGSGAQAGAGSMRSTGSASVAVTPPVTLPNPAAGPTPPAAPQPATAAVPRVTEATDGGLTATTASAARQDQGRRRQEPEASPQTLPTPTGASSATRQRRQRSPTLTAPPPTMRGPFETAAISQGESSPTPMAPPPASRRPPVNGVRHTREPPQGRSVPPELVPSRAPRPGQQIPPNPF